MQTPQAIIEIKPISIKENYALISDLMRGLHENERMLFDKTANWDDIEESYMKHVIEMQEDSDGTFLMAYYNGKPAGFIFGYLDEQDDSNIEDYTGLELYVSDGFVLPEYRRQGLYKKMNDLLEKIYIEKGVRKMTRFTSVNNKPMQNFLEGLGYTPTRFLYEKWLTDDGKS
jgi:ribosomal protein S18 acetylase RimI-like enzyme